MGGLSVSASVASALSHGGRLAGPLMSVLLLAACSLVGPAGPQATASPAASVSPTPSPTPVAPTRFPGGPPIANLELPDGSHQPGRLGRFCYNEACADSPWLPAPTMPRVQLDANGSITVALLDGEQFSRWSARCAGAADTEARVIRPLGTGGADDDSNRFVRATIDAPPTGEWVIEVFLTFAGQGDAAYYWYVAVP
jgi:hypothetical protein